MKNSILSSGFKEKKRGIVNTRKLQKKKEKINSRQSFQKELIPVNANANSAQNSVGPFHSSKTDNNPGKFKATPKIALKFAVVNGLENGKEKVGQDSVLVYKFKVKEEQFHIFGVFDGHGKHGHHVSLFLKKNLVPILKKEILQNRNKKEIQEILENCVKILHREIFEITKKFQQSYSNKSL